MCPASSTPLRWPIFAYLVGRCRCMQTPLQGEDSMRTPRFLHYQRAEKQAKAKTEAETTLILPSVSSRWIPTSQQL